MKQIGREMHERTGGALAITNDAVEKLIILDLCMAPGGFLSTALEINPGARALGMSLPEGNGGHKVLLPDDANVTCNFLDITMLATDMGTTHIPADHPDATNFLPQHFHSDQLFDIVFCDGQVLRTHERAAYRERREASRLTLTQLAIGLEHLRPGGTIVVLLHRVEMIKSVSLLYTFSKFSSVQLFKPVKHHAKRSSFYMVATDVQSGDADARGAVAAWKKQWEAATFGTEEVYRKALWEESVDVVKVLEEFGPELVRMGREVWSIQADALSVAPWVRRQKK